MKNLLFILQYLVLSISSVEAVPSLVELNNIVTQELSKTSELKTLYTKSIMKYGCSDVSIPLDVVNCHIKTSLIEEPALVQYYGGFDGGVYRGSLFYLESGTQSLRFAAIDIYFQHEILENGSETLKVIKIGKNNPITVL
jgi:hypothetical protein